MNARWMLTLGLVAVVAACGADAPESGEATVDQRAMDAAAAGAPAEPTPEEAAEPQPPAPETMAVRTEEPAPPAPATRRYDRLYTIQIAAYLNQTQAEQLASRLGGRGLPIWVAQAMVGGQNWTRVRIGASPSLSETRDLGSWITREFGSAVWVAPVDQAAESVPAGAVEQTREFLTQR